MSSSITAEQMKFIVEKMLDNASDAIHETGNGEDDFLEGKKLAYYEMLDTMKNQLIVDEQDLERFGLNVDLEKVLA